MVVIRRKGRASRRFGVNLTDSEKDPFLIQNSPPGMQNTRGYPRLSDFAKRLYEKQKIRFIYALNNKMLLSICRKAGKKRGSTVVNIVSALESRLDAVLLRGKLAPTIHAARQLISHNHCFVNGKPVNVRSYTLRPGDVLTLKAASQKLHVVQGAVANTRRECPAYLEFDEKQCSVKFTRYPNDPSEVPYPEPIDFNLIIGFYGV